MSSFSLALQEYQRGDVTLEALESQIERDIALGVQQASGLLEELVSHHAAQPLEETVLDDLKRSIHDAETRRRTQLGILDDDKTRLSPGIGGTTGSQIPTDPTGQGSAPQNRPVAVGDTINNRFILEELIGRGGMSQVFKAADKRRLEARSRDPYVALKVMMVEGVDPGEAFIAMQREVQKSQQLNHPCILRVNDFDRDGSIVYTTMEFLDGESLQQRLARTGKLPLEEALHVINQAGSALAYAHESKIVHADFKPSNVFLTGTGQVKVIDFGIARAIQAPDAPEEEKTVFDPRSLGALTPAYASPEMFEDGEPDPRDDIYSLGCVTYEVLAGRHPFSKLRSVDARDNEHPLKPLEDVSAPQWSAIADALHFDPGQRVPSVDAFLERLNRTPSPSVGSGAKVAAAAGLAFILGALAFWFTRGESEPAIVETTPTVSADCPHCPSVVAVAAGTGVIGTGNASDGSRAGYFEYPEFRVAIGDGIALGAREVTVGEFRAFAQASGRDFAGCRTPQSDWRVDPSRSWQNPGFPQSDTHPVTCVSWQDAQAYVDWLSAETGTTYRLPSETEWEYVARTQLALPETVGAAEYGCTSNVADASAAVVFPGLNAADCNDQHVYTAPTDRVGLDVIADLRGNVFEWTQDCWNPSYDGAPTDGSARTQGDCASRVLRGGSWFSAPDQQRLTYRNRHPISERSNTFGFRIVKET